MINIRATNSAHEEEFFETRIYNGKAFASGSGMKNVVVSRLLFTTKNNPLLSYVYNLKMVHDMDFEVIIRPNQKCFSHRQRQFLESIIDQYISELTSLNIKIMKFDSTTNPTFNYFTELNLIGDADRDIIPGVLPNKVIKIDCHTISGIYNIDPSCQNKFDRTDKVFDRLLPILKVDPLDNKVKNKNVNVKIEMELFPEIEPLKFDAPKKVAPANKDIFSIIREEYLEDSSEEQRNDFKLNDMFTKTHDEVSVMFAKFVMNYKFQDNEFNDFTFVRGKINLDLYKFEPWLTYGAISIFTLYNIAASCKELVDQKILKLEHNDILSLNGKFNRRDYIMYRFFISNINSITIDDDFIQLYDKNHFYKNSMYRSNGTEFECLVKFEVNDFNAILESKTTNAIFNALQKELMETGTINIQLFNTWFFLAIKLKPTKMTDSAVISRLFNISSMCPDSTIFKFAIMKAFNPQTFIFYNSFIGLIFDYKYMCFSFRKKTDAFFKKISQVSSQTDMIEHISTILNFYNPYFREAKKLEPRVSAFTDKLMTDTPDILTATRHPIINDFINFTPFYLMHSHLHESELEFNIELENVKARSNFKACDPFVKYVLENSIMDQNEFVNLLYKSSDNLKFCVK
ncbi:hypothetical protein [Carp edema virus]|nr:hypothetical protein [Carp edema virus]